MVSFESQPREATNVDMLADDEDSKTDQPNLEACADGPQPGTSTVGAVNARKSGIGTNKTLLMPCLSP